MLVDVVEVGLASTVAVVLLICTHAYSDASVPVFMGVPSTTIGCWSMPVGWPVFSAVGARSHGALRPSSCRLSCIVIGWSASSTLSNRVVGRFISTLTSSVREHYTVNSAVHS